jgi:hypothetical protein
MPAHAAVALKLTAKAARKRTSRRHVRKAHLRP